MLIYVIFQNCTWNNVTYLSFKIHFKPDEKYICIPFLKHFWGIRKMLYLMLNCNNMFIYFSFHKTQD